MKPVKLRMILLALGLLGAAAMAATASAAPSVDRFGRQLDSAGVHADSTMGKVDSTMAKPDSTAAHAAGAAAAPVAPAPAPQTPPPAPAPAAVAPAPAAAAAPASKPAGENKIYYGGTVTASFGSTTSIGFWPMLGYKLTPKISGGAEAGYEYLSYGNGQSTHNYGAALFGRFRVGRNLYAHAEFQNINYEIFTTNNSSTREWVPALLLGGGYVKKLNARTSVYGEVLFDVLQADNSPYKAGDPVVNVGVAVGF
jgi:hypothetical protein